MKVKLLADHYIRDTYLLSGRVIGEGTDFDFAGPPSHEMEGLDKASIEACDKVRTGFFNSAPFSELAMTMGEAK